MLGCKKGNINVIAIILDMVLCNKTMVCNVYEDDACVEITKQLGN